MQHKRFGALSSSINPDELALRVRAAILGLSSLIILVAGAFGHSILPDQIEQFATNVAVTVSTIGTVVSIIGLIYGSIRALIVHWFERRPEEGATS